MEGQELKEGKERVRQYLIEPLERIGMVRKRRCSAEKHQAMLGSLEARLAYMSADRLQGLAETVERNAGGAMKHEWPAEVSIMNWARRLQAPPASESRLVRSYLQSGAGDAAVAGGYVVELFYHLKKYGAPPNDYSTREIRRDAQGNQRRLANIERDQEANRASPSDLAWLDGYMGARRRCLDIVNAKKERAVA